jgi:hypothetical protein
MRAEAALLLPFFGSKSRANRTSCPDSAIVWKQLLPAPIVKFYGLFGAAIEIAGVLGIYCEPAND